ncbi:MAG: hypothetical protein ACI9WU_004501 [Myxococcota bacterium]|jgi:uncharacterized protein (DUF1501 family)
MTPKHTRRNFLANSLAAGTALSAIGGAGPLMRLAQAAGPKGTGTPTVTDRYFIFCYFGGGWDILLSLDPRDPNVFTADVAAQTRILPAYESLNAAPEQMLIPTSHGFLGGYLGDLATKHADKISVVRGINMETLSHDAGQKRFVTGKPPSGTQARGSSAATWFSSMLGQGNIIPQLASGTQSFNADQPTWASPIKVANVGDLLSAVRPQDPHLDPLMNQQIEALLAEAAECPKAQGSAFRTAAELARGKSVEMAAGGLDAGFDFAKNSPEMAAVRDHYGFSGSQLSSGAARAAMAARAVINGVSRVVSVNVAGGLDTHFDNWTRDQGPRQMAGFNAIARMMEDLAAHQYFETGDSWLDHTNIVAFSEFSRTALINERGGRDHWLNNACLVAGADIQGGKAVGQSSDVGMQPMPFDPETGLADEGGVVLKPEHVMQTFFHSLGVTNDPADLRVGPISALMK